MVAWIWELIVMAGAGLAGTGIAAVIPAWELRVRTPAGTALWLQVEGFRRFLTTAGTDQVDDVVRRGHLPPAHRVAVALGVHDHWSRAVTTSTSAQAADAAPSSPGFVQAPSRAATLASTVPSVVGTGSHDDRSRTDHSSSDSFGRGGGGPGGGSW